MKVLSSFPFLVGKARKQLSVLKFVRFKIALMNSMLPDLGIFSCEVIYFSGKTYNMSIFHLESS